MGNHIFLFQSKLVPSAIREGKWSLKFTQPKKWKEHHFVQYFVLKLRILVFNNYVSIWHVLSIYQICCWKSCNYCKSKAFLQYESECVFGYAVYTSWIWNKSDTTIGLCQPLLEQSVNKINRIFVQVLFKILVFRWKQNYI